MKKRVLARWLPVLAAVLLLCSCAEKITPPDDDTVGAAYAAALEAYGWFDLTTMPLDYGVTAEKDGYVYNKVDHETIHTRAALEAYLQSIFTKDIADRLLADKDRYVDIDGELYALAADRGTDITKGDEKREIVRESPEKIICRITVDVLDEGDLTTVVGTETHDMVYEYIGGSWLFSSFESVR